MPLHMPLLLFWRETGCLGSQKHTNSSDCDLTKKHLDASLIVKQNFCAAINWSVPTWARQHHAFDSAGYAIQLPKSVPP